MTLTPSRPPRQRPKYRPPIGIPMPRQRSTGSAVLSVVLHGLIILLLIGPIIAHEAMADNEGAGGKGPSGGGGGGNRGSQERANYIQVAPPVQKQPQQPQVVPPPVVKPPEPQVEQPPTPQPIVTAPTVPVTGTATGAGSGSDGTGGAGPGTGGGVGSGDGTGRGSGTGPGTGGGTGKVYPPTVTHLAMLPVPVPSRVRPYTLEAVFEVDEKGNAKLLRFNESKDSDYNKKVRAMLAEIRFRPAVKADGTPVRDTVSIFAEARH